MTETITAQEAWEAVERLRLDISHNGVKNEWCAVQCGTTKFDLGWGATPLEAVAALLARIGETVTKVEVANGISG